MKKNLGTLFGLPRWGAGAVVLAFCAFTPASRADVIVNNTGGVTFGDGSGAMYAQVFTMPASGEANLSSLTLTLDSVDSGSGSAEVYVYNTDGTLPTTVLYNLGSVSLSSPSASSVNPSVDSLTLGGTYAIVVDLTGGIAPAWYDTSSSGSGGTALSPLGGSYYLFGGTWDSNGGGYFQMDLEAVPEVPMTGLVMGFGALAIAIGHTLRRKLRPAVSSIA